MTMLDPGYALSRAVIPFGTSSPRTPQHNLSRRLGSVQAIARLKSVLTTSGDLFIRSLKLYAHVIPTNRVRLRVFACLIQHSEPFTLHLALLYLRIRQSSSHPMPSASGSLSKANNSRWSLRKTYHSGSSLSPPCSVCVRQKCAHTSRGFPFYLV